MDVQSCHATRAGAVSERGNPSRLSSMTAGGWCTPWAAATLCTCWRSHGIRSCGISAATSTVRQYTVSTAPADTLRSPIHRRHHHLAPTPPRISSPSPRIHHHHHRSRRNCRHCHRHHPPAHHHHHAQIMVLRSTITVCTIYGASGVEYGGGGGGGGRAGMTREGGVVAVAVRSAAGVIAAPRCRRRGRWFTVGDGQHNKKRCADCPRVATGATLRLGLTAPANRADG